MVIKKLLILLTAFLLVIPVFADDPIKEAKKHYDKGRYDKALKIYKTVKAKFPGTDWEAVSYLMMAKIYEQKGDFDKAIDLHKKIIKKFSKNTLAEEAFFSVARLRTIAGDASKAIKAYKAYLNIYPHGQLRVIALFNIASLYREKNKDRTAIKYYGAVLKNYPNEMWFHSWSAIYSGHIYMGRNEFDKAIEYYQRVIKSDKNKFMGTLSKLHIGQAHLEKGNNKAAQNVFQNILRTTNQFSEEALYGLAKAHYRAGEYEMAHEVLDTILQMFPQTIWEKDIKSKLKNIDKKLKKKNKK